MQTEAEEPNGGEASLSARNQSGGVERGAVHEAVQVGKFERGGERVCETRRVGESFGDSVYGMRDLQDAKSVVSKKKSKSEMSDDEEEEGEEGEKENDVSFSCRFSPYVCEKLEDISA